MSIFSYVKAGIQATRKHGTVPRNRALVHRLRNRRKVNPLIGQQFACLTLNTNNDFSDDHLRSSFIFLSSDTGSWNLTIDYRIEGFFYSGLTMRLLKMLPFLLIINSNRWTNSQKDIFFQGKLPQEFSFINLVLQKIL